MVDANGVRVDVWLWAARFFRTRSLSRQAIDGGKIEVNNATCKPARQLRVGDELRITRGEERFVVVVLALSDRRGAPMVAQALYRETEASLAARDAARESRRMLGAAGPRSRPDKSARRLLRELKQQH